MCEFFSSHFLYTLLHPLICQSCVAHLEGQLVVYGRHLGGHVHGRGRVHDEILDGLVRVPLPTGHQVEDELKCSDA